MRGLGTIASRIAVIKIGSQSFGTVGAGDHFGWVAEAIASITVAKGKVLLSAGLETRTIGVTGDLAAREVL